MNDGPAGRVRRGWRLAFLLAGLAMAPDRAAAASVPLLRIVSGGSTATNLLRNGSFEQGQGTTFGHWSAAPNGYRVASGEGRGGGVALACEAVDETGWRGASQTLVLNRTEALPVTIRGWSRAEGVSGAADAGYALYVDIIYQDGTPLWGQTGNFSAGTHDWEKREFVIVPEQPIRTLSVYCLIRGHAGRVWFDDVAVDEARSDGTAVMFQGRAMELVSPTPPASGPAARYVSGDGLELRMAGQRVVGVRAGERDLSGSGPGGFLVRDVAADSDVLGFEDGECTPLGLRLQAKVEEHPDHLAVEGMLTDTRGQDRAILLLFALPIETTGWVWADDIRRVRTLAGRTELANVSSVGCGTTGTLSTYPLGAIQDAQTGLALALDMARPAQYRIACHAGTRQFFLAFDFGLVPETDLFPGAARFRFVLFRFAPEWGFRAAWRKLMDLFPDHFEVRSREQGIWMPFTDVSTVLGWSDFGFRYHEGNNNVGFDDAQGILSFRYTEPMTWWMSMDPSLPRTETEALRVRDAYAQGASGAQRQMARISQTAAMLDAEGHPALRFRNEPWANGAVWSLNPNPFLPANPNAATVYWNDGIRTQLYDPGAATHLDGEYLDSLEGYVTADLNYSRDHCRWTTVPLTFATDSFRPALFKGLAAFEFTRWISTDVHQLGRLMFANGVPYRFAFLTPWLDVMGTETDWLPEGVYQPSAHSQLALWRTLSGAKPYLLLMNTDFDGLAPYVERYFQRSLFYGFYPSMFSHNASENPYWQKPAWYNRDRALFKKYIPVIRQVAQAGWQPVTGAVADPTSVWVERFGPDPNGRTYYTLFNEGPQETAATLRELRADPGPPGDRVARDLLAGTPLEWRTNGWRVTLAANAATALCIEPGPRFAGVEFQPDGTLQVSLAAPAGWAHVVEASPDLACWAPVRTNEAPQVTSHFALVIDALDPGPRFYRLRW